MPIASSWSAFTTTSEANRRAAGRRHYNAMRRFNGDLRRVEVGKLITAYGLGRGVKARIARELGVHPSTISRDLREMWGSPDGQTCETCERWMADKHWVKLEDDRTKRLASVLAMTRASSEVA